MTDTAAGGRNYREVVGMGEALPRFFQNYINFSGRSNRGEFWWAYLAIIIISIVTIVIDAVTGVPVLNMIWSLATLVPGIAMGIRRLHDINRSGWWYLLVFVPVVGIIVLIVWWCKEPDAGPNQFG